jgi:RNA polymerase sigma-70 factor, ECF subfamily
MLHHQAFEEYRALLFSIAYRMLGSTMEAEDIVQEVYLKFSQIDLEGVTSVKYYLTTITTRLCINQLKSTRVQRETYLGTWLPEPILTDAQSDLMNPAQRATVYDTISMAFMVMIEQLTPAERAVFLLREIFDYDYAEIGNIIDKNEASCRKIFSRAKKHIQANRPRFDTQPDQHQLLLKQFIATVEKGDLDGLITMLADDVTLLPDGGGTRGAAIRILRGSDAVAKFVIGITNKTPLHEMTFGLEQVNEQWAIVIRHATGDPFNVILMDTSKGKIECIYTIAGEQKLHGLVID